MALLPTNQSRFSFFSFRSKFSRNVTKYKSALGRGFSIEPQTYFWVVRLVALWSKMSKCIRNQFLIKRPICKVGTKLVPHAYFSPLPLYISMQQFGYTTDVYGPLFILWADCLDSLYSFSILQQLTCVNKLWVWDLSFIPHGDPVSTFQVQVS